MMQVFGLNAASTIIFSGR